MSAAAVLPLAEAMTHGLVVLPRVWATATPETGGGIEKKRPHGLRLVASGSARVSARPEPEQDEHVAFYRKYTEGMLHRYQKLSMESGRVPSLLGQEMFRGRVTSYRVRSFEDVVIFVHDVGRCFELLDAGQQEVLRRVALQEYTQGETARLMGVSLRTIVRRYAEALDTLTAIFLERKMLERLPGL